MDAPLVKTEVRGRVGLLTLNRPKALNALSNDVIAELAAAMRAFDADENIGAMVLTGSEKAFAAGADIGAMQGWSYMDVYKQDYLGGDWESLKRIRKPIIAAVAGYALGGGCELAMLCDFIIAAENARFGQPEIKLGVIPGYGGTQRLPRAISKAKAMDLVLTARMMDAQEAERAGLVSRVVPAERLLDEALVSFDCRIAQAHEVGSHTIFYCEVLGIRNSDSQEGLVYFNRAYHRLGDASKATS